MTSHSLTDEQTPKGTKPAADPAHAPRHRLAAMAILACVVVLGLLLLGNASVSPRLVRLVSAVSSSSRLITPNTPALVAPQAPLRLYYIGHSLVGRDMPAMTAQLAQAAGFDGHGYESQLGWGATLESHFEDGVEIPGFEHENAHPQFRPAHEAVASGDYDAVVLTEMVELRDALRWHNSGYYLQQWVRAARAARPGVTVYLYETWHRLTDPLGWEVRLFADAITLWEQSVAARTWRDPQAGAMHLIPVGRVFAEYCQRVKDQISNMGATDSAFAPIDALFARNPDGTLDPIHLSDQGAYLSALTQFATLYHRDPTGLPSALRRADGTPATAPNPETAALMQRVTWDVVSSLSVTGVPRAAPGQN